MLYFFEPTPAQQAEMANRGSVDGPLRLEVKLPDSEEPVWVVASERLRATHSVGDQIEIEQLPQEACSNIDPYLRPAPITAAGGFVVRLENEHPQLLSIFRQGVWDLPKGKQDPGEDIRTCARREVQEEVGIDEIRILAPFGRTVHGYPEGELYRVKTTHWFLMQTPERSFVPQAKENITAVEWIDWQEAAHRLGYQTLRDHLIGNAGLMRRVLDLDPA